MNFPTVSCIDDSQPALNLRKATLKTHGYCVQIASSSTPP
jgi:hypothetical protein